MDEVLTVLKEIKEYLYEHEIPDDDYKRYEYFTGLLYLKYTLDIVHRKLTNTLEDEHLDKIRSLKKNFEYLEELKKLKD